jgi:hypothetical protein
MIGIERVLWVEEFIDEWSAGRLFKEQSKV